MYKSMEFNHSDFQSGVYEISRLVEGGVKNDLGLVIPNYQRDYTWEEPDVERLFNDLLSGLSTRSQKPSGTFFGATVWCERDRENEDEFKDSSFDIVDGQQRITSCVLLAISLALKINDVGDQIDYSSLSQNLQKWLKTQLDEIHERVCSMVYGEQKRAASYPRVIHEEDVRGSTVKTSDYRSPLAKIQMHFADAFEKGKISKDFELITVDDKYQNVFSRLVENIDYLYGYLGELSNEIFFINNNIKFVEKESLLKKNLRELFQKSLPSEVEKDLTKAIDTNPLVEMQIRLIQFSKYYFHASCFSIITCRDEDAAFSIFDSLNTTGVPLTAIETLKPFVMRDYRQDKKKGTFEKSAAETFLRTVNETIRTKSNDTNKQSKISKELIIHTVLLGNGTSPNNNLTTQRHAIREMQQMCNSNGHIDLTSEVLKNISEYRSKFSIVENIRNFSSSTLEPSQVEKIKLTNSFLSETKTKLYLPILTRFYWDEKQMVMFHDACKAITAFYVLRRSTTSSTDRIDDIFRSCLANTSTYSGLNLSNRPPGELTPSDFINFKNHLKVNLSTKSFSFTLKDKEKWVGHVKKLNLYSNAKKLLKFMLFAAHDGAKKDDSDNTLIQADDATPDSSTEFLNFSTWDKRLYETLEHVAPQNEKSIGWDKVYEDANLKHTIGNFVLLPQGQNSSLSDKSWEVKKLFLKVLLADSLTGRMALVNKHKLDSISLPLAIEKEVLSPKSPLVKSHMLSGLDNVKNWDAKYIEKRSERLCSLVWDKMVSWLN